MIYIATHKKFKEPHLRNYCILQVGAEGKEDFGYLKDNSGDNISKKNPYFCELTGLYWIWKNCDDTYKGLVHYRRYFGKSNLSNDIRKTYTYDELVKFLDDVDILLSYVEVFKQNARDEILLSCCTVEIFNNLRDVIAQKHPDYIKVFDEYFSQNKSVLFNMIFCKREVFDSYCEWLFPILFELEKFVDIERLNDYQQRIYGFLAERLLNIWVYKNKLKVKNLPVINTELSRLELLELILRRKYHKVKFIKEMKRESIKYES